MKPRFESELALGHGYDLINTFTRCVDGDLFFLLWTSFEIGNPSSIFRTLSLFQKEKVDEIDL